MGDKFDEVARDLIAEHVMFGEARGELESAIAQAIRMAVEEERKWQPIETAPKDGTQTIIVWAIYHDRYGRVSEEREERIAWCGNGDQKRGYGWQPPHSFVNGDATMTHWRHETERPAIRSRSQS